MRYLEVGGSPFERGQTIGRSCRAEIRAMVDEHLVSLQRLSLERTARELSAESFATLCRRCISAVRGFADGLLLELAGIADGAGCSLEEVLGLNLFLDAFDVTFPGFAAQLVDGCTAFAVSPPAAADDQIYAGQNYDVRGFLHKGNLVLKIEQPAAPAALVYTFAGVVGCAGINSAGLGVVINKLTPRDSRPGVPYPFLLRTILEQPGLGDAINAIARCRRASGLNYLMADRYGEIVSVETSATRFAVLHGLEGYLAHTNHYVHTAMQAWETPVQQYNGDSYVRWGRINKLLARQAGHITAETLRTALCDHSNHPESICRHPRSGRSNLMTGSTATSLLMDLRQCSLAVTDGSPCAAEPAVYRLDSAESRASERGLSESHVGR